MALIVTALLVTVKDSNGAVKYLNRGDVVPDGTDKSSIKHLQDLGFVSKGEMTGPPPVEPEDAPKVESASKTRR